MPEKITSITPDELNGRITAGNTGGVYLLGGEEPYLVRHYAARLGEGCGEFDRFSFNGETFSAGAFIDAASMYPQDGKYIYIKVDCAGAKLPAADKKDLTAFLENVPETLCAVFTTGVNEKKNDLADAVSKYAVNVDFPLQKGDKLRNWLARVFKSEGIDAPAGELGYMISVCGGGMDELRIEAAKIAAYARAMGESVLRRAHVDAQVIKEEELTAFELSNALLARDTAEAAVILEKMRSLGEDAARLPAQIGAVFCDMELICLAGREMSGAAAIARATGIHEYRVKLMQSAVSRLDDPLGALSRSCALCREYDDRLKSTSVSDGYRMAREMLFKLRYNH